MNQTKQPTDKFTHMRSTIAPFTFLASVTTKKIHYYSILLIFSTIFFSSSLFSQTVIWEDDFETDKGWTLTGEFERGTPSGGAGDHGNANPTSAFSGTSALGTDLDGSYPNDLTDRQYTAISPSFDCSGFEHIELKFQRWLNVEEPAYDHAYIEVSNDGTNWNVIWSNSATIEDASWTEQTFNISSYASNQNNVQIRFALGSTDVGWYYSGWNIDDVQITGQDNIWFEDFTLADGTNSGTGTPAIASWTADGGDRGVTVNGNQLRGRNTRNPNPDQTTWEIDVADPIEIGGFSDISVIMDISNDENLDNGDYIQIQYNIDETGWVNFSSNGYINDDFSTTTAYTNGISGVSLRLRVIIYCNNDNEVYYIDNIAVTGTPTSSSTGTNYYSYQTGNWNSPMTWTHDPGGTTQTATDVPHEGDNVIILNSRTVTLTADVDTANLDITLREGGILNQSTFAFSANIAALRGSGFHKLASTSYPAITTNDFTTTDGGTTEYYNSANFTLPNSQTEYYNLKINAPGITATQLNNININGDLLVTQGTYQINDNSSTTKLNLTINGDVTVNSGASIMVGNGSTNSTTSPNIATTNTPPFIDYYEQFHRVVIYGDFTNNGTVKFTNLSYPVYNALPPTNSGATSGAASVYFMGATNNTLTCNGTSDFYNLILDKGIDKTYKLTVYSSAYTNFRIFGANSAGGDLTNATAANPNLKKAVWIRTGTLELSGLSIIPSLVEGNDCGATPNSDFYIPANGALLLSGSEVIVLSTADSYQDINLAYNVSAPNDAACGVVTNSCTSFSIYGLVQVDDGYFSTRESGGFITWDVASGRLEINGGIVDSKQYRSAGNSGGLASFHQSGGTFILRGRFQRLPSAYSNYANLKDYSTTTLNTTRKTDGLNGALATFNINEAANVFDMSGGTIQIYDVCGTAAGQNAAIEILSDAVNNSVTGGTIEIIPTTGSDTDATEFNIESNAPFYNLTINRASSSASVDVNTYSLEVLNNLQITSGELNANNLNVTVGGNFSINNGTTYTAGSNTTIFNGAHNQLFTFNTASALAINKLSIDKPTGTKLTLAGSQNTLSVNDSLAIYNAELNDGGKTIQLSGNGITSVLYSSGTHTGQGKIELNDTDNDQIIDGNGSASFCNIDLNNSNTSNAPVSLNANTTIAGKLTLSQDKIFDISKYNLTFIDTAEIVNAGTNRFIATKGTAGDGGITKIYNNANTSFTFPLGAASTNHANAEYSPASIAFESNPITYGSITVLPVGYEHSNTTTKNRSLSYYWRVKSSGFDLGTAQINHSYTYSENDVLTGGDVNENEYVAAYYNASTYTWTKATINEINETTNTIGGTGTAYQTLDFIDGEFTAGDIDATDPFGTPTVYYSRQSGLWSDTDSWTFNSSHSGAIAGSVPGASDIVIIGGQDSVYLYTELTNANQGTVSCATLKIETGSALDIGYNPACNFSIVANHENGNGNFRITCDRGPLNGSTVRTFEFPSGDFSDFNQNLGTTELYTTNNVAGTTFYLPDGTESYGNLIISPLGGSNIIFPNHDLLIYGKLVTRGQNADSWFCPSWSVDYPGGIARIAKTITINGDLDIEGGALVWYGNGNIEQNIVIHGDVYVAENSAIDVWSAATSQSLMIGGSLINNTIGTTAGGTSTPRRCDFRELPVTFFGSGTAKITNTSNTPLTIFENLTINKGTSQSDSLIIDIEGTLTTPTNNWLTLENGTLVYEHNDDFTITEGSSFTIPSTAGLSINSSGNDIYIANDNVNNNDLYLYGKLSINDGNVYVGETGAPNNNNDIEYSASGNSEIEIQGGSLTVNGQIRRNPSTTSGILKYTQSGGAATINGRNALAENAKLEILNSGSEFNMSGGTLTIVRGGGDGTYGDLYLRPENSTVTAGEIIFTPGTIGDQDYIFDATCPIYNLTINGSNGNTANVELLVSELTIKNNLTLTTNTSSLDANVAFNIPVTINGDFNNSGTYNHRNNTTTFNGGTQEILGSTTNSFYNLVVSPITSLTLNDNITIENSLDLDDGTLAIGANTVYVAGSFNNDANYSESSVGVILNGSAQQSISGTGTFARLELNNNNGAKLLNSITLTKNIALTNGIFDINKYLLTLGENSNIEGSGFDNTKMITSDGVFSNVGIKKIFNASTPAATVFTFPMGTGTKYTPAVLTINAIGSTGAIRINNIDDKHPGTLSPYNVLNYFWEVENIAITGLDGNLVLNYIETDVAGTEANYLAAQLITSENKWIKSNNVNTTNKTITFNLSAATPDFTGEYSAGEDTSIPGVVPEYTSQSNGDWTNTAIWVQTAGDSYTLSSDGPNGFIVNIDHEITTDKDHCSAYKTYINNKLIIDESTSGHNFGTIYGNGTLALESGTFPAGKFENFLACGNNGFLEYGGTGNYTLIADLYDEIANIAFTGSGSRVLPNKNLTICNSFNISGATVDNSIYNKQLIIRGSMEMSSGNFLAGSGSNATVTFQGSVLQTIGGSTGDFAFNNLEIDNNAGLNIGANGAITVGGNLLLSDGLINTTENNTLAITNTSTSCVTPTTGQSSSYVNGPLTKKINQGDSFTFPIGNSSSIGNKLKLSATQTGTIDWTVEYFTPNSTYNSYNTPLSYVNSNEYWKVSASSGDNAKININWDANSDLTPANTQFGVSDMRVANYDETNTVWNGLPSTATGSNSSGTVTSSSRFTVPASGSALFTTACINTVKPRAKFTPSGAVCGTAGIPVTFSSNPATTYLLSYTVNGLNETTVTINNADLPYTLPTLATGGVYKLTEFTYEGGAKTGAVDQSEITAYELPTTALAGDDQSLCGASQATLDGNNPTVGSGLWTITSGTGGSFTDATVFNTNFSGTNGTGYTLQWTIDNGGCTSDDVVDIDFPLLAAQPGNFTTYNDQICKGETGVTFTVPEDATVSYNWSFSNAAQATFNGSGSSVNVDFTDNATDGTISVSASNACGASASRDIAVTLNPLPEFTLTDDDADDLICRGATVNFTTNTSSGPTINNYQFFVNGISMQNGAGNSYSNSTLINGSEINAIATSTNNCSISSDTITLSVADAIWNGTSSDWFANSNWACGDVPTNADDIIIPSGIAFMPEIDGAGAACNAIEIQALAELTLVGTNNLDVWGNWVHNGDFSANNGSVSFKNNTSLSGSNNLDFYHLVIDGTLNSSADNVNINGNLTNNGTFNNNGGTITFKGSAEQNIYGDFTGTEQFYNLAINNASGLVLNGDVTIDNRLRLINGTITPGANNMLMTANASTLPERGTPLSYVNGKLHKTIGTIGDSFVFPVGKDGYRGTVSVNSVSTAGLTWEVEYFQAPATNESGIANFNAATVDYRITQTEYWKISDGPTAPPGVTAYIGLSWNAGSGVAANPTDRQSLEVMAWNGTNWNEYGGGSFSAGHTQTDGSFTSTSLLSFSEKVVTLGDGSSNNSLPVELTTFTGSANNSGIELLWTTESELNNDYFEIQRSIDAINFSTIGKVIGNGTTMLESNYKFTDKNPLNGTNYYRLMQYDFDGTPNKHKTIAVYFDRAKLATNNIEINVYPNPYKLGNLTIDFDKLEPYKQIYINLVDMGGKTIANTLLTIPENGKINLVPNLVNGLKQGIYMLNIQTKETLYTKKLIVN